MGFISWLSNNPIGKKVYTAIEKVGTVLNEPLASAKEFIKTGTIKQTQAGFVERSEKNLKGQVLSTAIDYGSAIATVSTLGTAGASAIATTSGVKGLLPVLTTKSVGKIGIETTKNLLTKETAKKTAIILGSEFAGTVLANSPSATNAISEGVNKITSGDIAKKAGTEIEKLTEWYNELSPTEQKVLIGLGITLATLGTIGISLGLPYLKTYLASKMGAKNAVNDLQNNVPKNNAETPTNGNITIINQLPSQQVPTAPTSSGAVKVKKKAKKKKKTKKAKKKSIKRKKTIKKYGRTK